MEWPLAIFVNAKLNGFNTIRKMQILTVIILAILTVIGSLIYSSILMGVVPHQHMSMPPGIIAKTFIGI